MEVFRALAAWTEFHPAARQPRLAARIARCVRLPSLLLPELYALGDHPLVSLADHLLLKNEHHPTFQLPKCQTLGVRSWLVGKKRLLVDR